MKELLKKLKFLIPSAMQFVAVAAILITGFVAYNLGSEKSPKESAGGPTTRPAQAAGAETETIWTCSMHPQIQMEEPGQCPICGMDLVPMEEAAGTVATAPAPAEAAVQDPLGYACAMNCVPPLPHPGKCPICGMDMVAVYEEAPAATTGNPERQLTMSREAKALANIQTTEVERRWVENIVRMVGFVDYDETRLGEVSAYVSGRLEELFVDYTGTMVRKGDHMVQLYSPDLLTAQEELIQAKKSFENLRDSNLENVRESSRRALEAARERLRLWGIKPEQIATIEETGVRQDHITIYSPMGGIVIEKHVKEGDYVETGERIYTIADLSLVWVKLKAYESDLPWLRYGQDVEFETEAYPGETFHGRIAFIDPILNPMTRTVSVRVNVENERGMLKPGMFVRARVESRLAKGGRVIEPDLAGKWIGPMHPEVLRDEPGTCPICGMDLVPAEELGFVAAVADTPPLVIPVSAALVTGKRAVAYVEVPGTEVPTYEGREIVLGPRAGDSYIVLEGLQEGERVVTHGSFKIDSALQIVAKPSMMNPEGGAVTTGHEHHGEDGDVTPPEEPRAQPEVVEAEIEGRGEAHEHPLPAMITEPNVEAPPAFVASLSPVYDAYFELQLSLAADDFEEVKEKYRELAKAVGALSPTGLSGAQMEEFLRRQELLRNAIERGAEAESLEEARRVFESVSKEIMLLHNEYGHAGEQPFYLVNCPMAFEWKGADWLQASNEIRNPYFGSEMLTCGQVLAEVGGEQ